MKNYMKKISATQFEQYFNRNRNITNTNKSEILKMKTILSSVVICITLSLIPFAQSQAITLKIATLSPEGATWMVKMREGAKKIKKLTNNRVKFKFYPGGVMGNDQSVLRKIRIGQLHGGALPGGSFSAIYPDAQLYGFPFLFKSLDEVKYVREKMDQELIKGLEEKGFVNFGFAEGGFAYFMSKQPLRNISDAKKQKIWVPTGDNISKTVFNTAQVSTISLQVSDVMTSLQTGLINTVVSSPIAAIALQWHTRIKYLTDAPLSYFFALLAIDKKAFRKINPDDQTIVRDVMGNVFKEIDKQNREDNIKAKKALKNQGIGIITLSDETLSDWYSIGKRARKELSDNGKYSPEIMKTLQKHLHTIRNTPALSQK